MDALRPEKDKLMPILVEGHRGVGATEDLLSACDRQTFFRSGHVPARLASDP